jgi:HAD superfamily hydrolase (TIGR01509 family)
VSEQAPRDDADGARCKRVAILDIDGTLVDTNYQHALAWYRAFRKHDVVLPIWRIHRHIGMGGDQLVPALTDERFERERGDEVRDAEKGLYMAMIDEVEPMRDARRLIEDIRTRGHKALLASSAKQDEVDHYLDLLDARELADGWTSSADVQSTKPQPDLVQAALEKAGADADDALMIGDTPWDVEAAKRAGVPTIAVMTGGFAAQELREAGAVAVYESVAELRERLDETSLR